MLESSGKDVATVAKNLSIAVTSLSTWLADRGLELNEQKTQVMFIPPRGMLLDKTRLTVSCRAQRLTIVTEVKYLGLLLDCDLTFTPHVNSQIKRTRRLTSALWKARASLSRKSKRLFYLAMVQSTLSYSSNAFYSCITNGNMELLNQVSKSAVRAMQGLPRWTSTTPLFASLHISKLAQVFRQKIVKFVFRCLHGLTSRLLHDHFVRTTTVRNQERNTLVVPFWRGPAGRATIQFHGTQLWNSLPHTLREVTDFPLFCALVKALEIDPLL